jgi:fumarylacetoacetase
MNGVAPRSWVASANDPTTDFSLRNLPYGIFSTPENPALRVGVAIGDMVADLSALSAAGLLPGMGNAFSQNTLNPLMAQGRPKWHALRVRLTELLAESSDLAHNAALVAHAFVSQSAAHLHLPITVANYTDFYSSRYHAQNVGALFRDPARALNPNWLELPVGYHGRASSVVVSGTPIRRPTGQIKRPDAERPVLAPCERLDFELELGTIIGMPSQLGARVDVNDATAHIFGVVLLNDWSARDIQLWETQPLGPFNAKNFATTISPWVVPLEALEPYRCTQPVQDPVPLDYLRAQGPEGFDIDLEVTLRPQGSAIATTLTRTNFRHMYWTMAQQIAHHTVGGCNLQIGDLLGSGTISGPEPSSQGCLLEQTLNGRAPVTLDGGFTRSFLEDGDTVTFTGRAAPGVGFGKCEGLLF